MVLRLKVISNGIMVLMVLLDFWSKVGLHKFSLSLWQNSSGNLWFQKLRCCIRVVGNFYYDCRCYYYCEVLFCLSCLGTGLWSCNCVFDRGIGFLGKLLCTTDRWIASCAGHQVVGLEVGWLCTTGTDPEICAGNLYWFIQSLVIFMNIETEFVMGTNSFAGLIIISRFGGWCLFTDSCCYGVSFVLWLEFGAGYLFKSGASLVLFYCDSNDNFSCTLFPCSKFSHRVFIWQGFLMRQGDWRLGDLMFQPPGSDYVMYAELDTFRPKLLVASWYKVCWVCWFIFDGELCRFE